MKSTSDSVSGHLLRSTHPHWPRETHGINGRRAIAWRPNTVGAATAVSACVTWDQFGHEAAKVTSAASLQVSVGSVAPRDRLRRCSSRSN